MHISRWPVNYSDKEGGGTLPERDYGCDREAPDVYVGQFEVAVVPEEQDSSSCASSRFKDEVVVLIASQVRC